MVMPDISGLLSFMPYLNILWYIVWILFFGSIAMMGYRGFLRWYLKWPIRIGLGFVSIIAGIGLGVLIPIDGIPMASFAKMFIGGLISGIVFAIALNIISYRMPGLIGGFENRVEHFQNKIKALKKDGPLKVITPTRIIGIALFCGFLIFSLINFTGFPTFENEVNSMIGDMTGMDMDDMSASCQALVNSLYSNIDVLTGSIPSPYNNPTMKAAYEQGCGESISGMYIFNSINPPIVIGQTSNQNVICLGSQTEFCTKLDLSGFM